MAEEENTNKQETEDLTVKQPDKSSGVLKEEDKKDKNIFQVLFANDNKLLTKEGGEVFVDNETRRMIALFSDGTYLVDEMHRFDGKVLNFTAIAKRRRMLINPPQYVSSQELSAIYAYAERGMGQVDISIEETADYQMQIDFLSVICYN